jgi:hypothetical protein
MHALEPSMLLAKAVRTIYERQVIRSCCARWWAGRAHSQLSAASAAAMSTACPCHRCPPLTAARRDESAACRREMCDVWGCSASAHLHRHVAPDMWCEVGMGAVADDSGGAAVLTVVGEPDSLACQRSNVRRVSSGGLASHICVRVDASVREAQVLW